MLRRFHFQGWQQNEVAPGTSNATSPAWLDMSAVGSWLFAPLSAPTEIRTEPLHGAHSGDLGFGRDMHCRKKANGDVVCYVTNYGTGYSTDSPDGDAGGTI